MCSTITLLRNTHLVKNLSLKVNKWLGRESQVHQERTLSCLSQAKLGGSTRSGAHVTQTGEGRELDEEIGYTIPNTFVYVVFLGSYNMYKKLYHVKK